MSRWLAGLALSMALAMGLEAFYRLGATWDPGVLPGAAFVYLLWLAPVHLAMAALPGWPAWVWLAVCGTCGLAFEWVAIGNSPWGNPEALQSGMFVFHGVYPVWGRLLLPGPPDRRRFWGWRTLALCAPVSLAGLALDGDLRRLWFLLVPLAPFYVLAALTFLSPAAGRSPAR